MSYTINDYIKDNNVDVSETYLDISYCSITSLKGIERFTNLIKLDMGHLNIIDYSSLKYLKYLKYLRCSYTNISNKDLEYIKDLNSLETLILSNTDIADVSVIKYLTNLRVLYLTNTKVSDITPIKDLNSLEQLYVRNTNISDISVIKYVPSLQVIYFNNTQVPKILNNMSIEEIKTYYKEVNREKYLEQLG